MLSFTHIPVAARAAHRVINVIVFIFYLSFFLGVTLTNLFTFYLIPIVSLVILFSHAGCYPYLLLLVF